MQKKAYTGASRSWRHVLSVQPSQPHRTDFKGIAIQFLHRVYNPVLRFVNAYPYEGHSVTVGNFQATVL